MKLRCVLPALALAWLPGQAAVPPSEFQVAVWAASCMACHGTDGKADGTSLALHGRSADELLRALRAYRTGERPATIMHQHARGYSDAELELIARYFATRR
jgi:cytochrome c553